MQALTISVENYTQNMISTSFSCDFFRFFLALSCWLGGWLVLSIHWICLCVLFSSSRDDHRTINCDWRCAKIKKNVSLSCECMKDTQNLKKWSIIFHFKETSNGLTLSYQQYLPKFNLNCKSTMRKRNKMRNNESKHCRMLNVKHIYIYMCVVLDFDNKRRQENRACLLKNQG